MAVKILIHKTFDPMQSDPWMNPIHVQLWYDVCHSLLRLATNGRQEALPAQAAIKLSFHRTRESTQQTAKTQRRKRGRCVSCVCCAAYVGLGGNRAWAEWDSWSSVSTWGWIEI